MNLFDVIATILLVEKLQGVITMSWFTLVLAMVFAFTWKCLAIAIKMLKPK